MIQNFCLRLFSYVFMKSRRVRALALRIHANHLTYLDLTESELQHLPWGLLQTRKCCEDVVIDTALDCSATIEQKPDPTENEKIRTAFESPNLASSPSNRNQNRWPENTHIGMSGRCDRASGMWAMGAQLAFHTRLRINSFFREARARSVPRVFECHGHARTPEHQSHYETCKG